MTDDIMKLYVHIDIQQVDWIALNLACQIQVHKPISKTNFGQRLVHVTFIYMVYEFKIITLRTY